MRETLERYLFNKYLIMFILLVYRVFQITHSFKN